MYIISTHIRLSVWYVRTCTCLYIVEYVQQGKIILNNVCMLVVLSERCWVNYCEYYYTYTGGPLAQADTFVVDGCVCIVGDETGGVLICGEFVALLVEVLILEVAVYALYDF